MQFFEFIKKYVASFPGSSPARSLIIPSRAESWSVFAKDLFFPTLANQTTCRGQWALANVSRAIADAGWSSFINMLEYKTSWYGSTLTKAPKYYASSKICSHCQHKKEKMPLNVRTWTCEKCGNEHDRDINAAKNILSTVSSTGIHACGGTSCGIGESLLAMCR